MGCVIVEEDSLKLYSFEKFSKERYIRFSLQLIKSLVLELVTSLVLEKKEKPVL